MKKISFLFLASILVSNLSIAQAPNILFVLIDDIRNTSLGSSGHPIIQTPNIDSLADNGTKFTNAFVTTSICAASRASILTGLYESSHNFTFGKPPIIKEQTDQSFPKLLQNKGYKTGYVGKWGMRTENPPQSLYDYYYPLHRNPYFKVQSVAAHNHETGICVNHAKDYDPTFIKPPDSLRHITELCGDFAIQFIENQPANTPFCLQVSFNAVHAEDSDKAEHFPPPKSVAEMYSDVTMPEPRLNNPAIYENMPDFLKTSLNRVRYFWRWDTPEKYQKNMTDYYRMISGVDKVIGRLVAALKKNGLDKNTIIIITGDNGYYMGDRGFAGKWSHFEESLRVPLIIYDPTIKKQQSQEELVLNIDIPATILDYGEVPIPKSYQGVSLKPLVKNTKVDNWRTSFFAEHRMNHKALPKWEGVRHERYVYANYYEQQPAYEFLHDLTVDKDQLVNLATDKKYQKILKQMRKKCRKKEKEYGIK